jgi:hypothetical protein
MECVVKKQIKDLELWELDFLVAKAEGLPSKIENDEYGSWCLYKYTENSPSWRTYSPISNPSQAWPIIERERITVEPSKIGNFWIASIDKFNYYHGKTSLEAAMRCFVASKFGDEVEL